MNANLRQVGGMHYHSEYQHWDLCLKVGLNYFEAAATKYVARWRAKNGVTDLQKALHYAQKLQEEAHVALLLQGQRFTMSFVSSEVNKFCSINKLEGAEKAIILLLATWQTSEQLSDVQDFIIRLLEEEGVVDPYAVPDPKPVPLTEENHYAERA